MTDNSKNKKNCDPKIIEEVREEIKHELEIKEKELVFTLSESILTLVGAVIIVVIPWISKKYFFIPEDNILYILISLFSLWAGLLIFILPIVRKIDVLIDKIY